MKTQRLWFLTAVLATAITSTLLRAAHNDDERIVSAAKKSYVYRAYLKDDHIKIEAKDGCVTLKGEVSNPAHKSMAGDTVENLPGVKSVDNRLEVKARSANEKPDDWIEFKVRSALLYHRSVSGTKTIVSASDGIVTLRGTASSNAQKELTEEYAKDVDGVKEVKNEIKVVPAAEPPARTVGEAIDDASITAQVKATLLTHRSTSALKTKVSTRDGVVTLTGEARNRAEKDLVTKLASDVQGVRSLVNNMEAKE
jgi:osmotically-inducible protein OsmY